MKLETLGEYFFRPLMIIRPNYFVYHKLHCGQEDDGANDGLLVLNKFENLKSDLGQLFSAPWSSICSTHSIYSVSQNPGQLCYIIYSNQ